MAMEQVEAREGTLSEWAGPYVTDMLGRAQAYAGTPFQPYEGAFTAGPSTLQGQAFQGIGSLTVPQNITQAGQTLGTYATKDVPSYQPGTYSPIQFTQQNLQQYMNPYLESVLEPQRREMQRQADIARNTMQSRMAQAGAYGGSRQAIMEAEAQRNLQQGLADLTGKGYAGAYEDAARRLAEESGRGLEAARFGEQSRQFGAGLGLQGLQTALQGAGQLGQLGQAEFGQQKDIIGLQSQMGAERQQLDQARKGQQYEDFMREKLYPYQQLEFMSNILRGTPMGTVTSMYTAPPSIGSQIAGLGLAGAGMYGMMNRRAKGGAIKDKEKPRAGLSELALMKMGA